MPQKGTLVVMAKRPRAGEVKTRLIPWLAAGDAAELYEAMLDDVLRRSPRPGIRLVLAHAPADAAPWFQDFAAAVNWNLVAQEGADLGARMRAVFDRFALAEEPVVMRNSDSPDLDVARIDEAFAALTEGADAVFGPDSGGGYYLVGLKRPHPELFQVMMSTSNNFDETIRRARSLDLNVAVLAKADDVDEPEDLRRLAMRLRRSPERASATAAWLTRRGTWTSEGDEGSDQESAGWSPAK